MWMRLHLKKATLCLQPTLPGWSPCMTSSFRSKSLCTFLQSSGARTVLDFTYLTPRFDPDCTISQEFPQIEPKDAAPTWKHTNSKTKSTGKRAECLWVGQTVVSVTNWLWTPADKARSLWAWSALCFFWRLSKGKSFSTGQRAGVIRASQFLSHVSSFVVCLLH